MAFPSAPVNIATQTINGPYVTLQPTADLFKLTLTAADATEGNQFTSSGHELMIVYNSDTNPHTLDVLSVAIAGYLRPGDIDTYNLDAGSIQVIGFDKANAPNGWAVGGISGGKIRFLASDALVKFAVLTVGARS